MNGGKTLMKKNNSLKELVNDYKHVGRRKPMPRPTVFTPKTVYSRKKFTKIE